MSRKIGSIPWILFVMGMLSMSFLASCGGGSEGGTSVVKVTVSPTAALLVQVGEERQFTAVITGTDGGVIDADVTWSSSDTASITVDPSGLVKSAALPGSAVITAEADGVVSNPVVVIAAQPASGAVLVDDSRVVGGFALDDPAGPWQVGAMYSVILTDVSGLSPGTILMSTGEQPVGGRVYATGAAAGGTRVTLETIPLDQMFAQLDIDLELDLSRLDYVVPGAVLADYDVVDGPGGKIDFNLIQAQPASQALSARAQPAAFATISADFGPFECEATMNSPLNINVQPANISIVRDLSLIFDYDKSAGGLQELGIRGEITGTFKLAANVVTQFDGKLECKAELARIPIPITGFISAFFGPSVPVGVGFDMGGKLTLSQVGFELEAKGAGILEAGLQCPSSAGCSPALALTTSSEAKFKWNTPPDLTSTYGAVQQIRLEPTISGFAFANLDAGFDLIFDTFTVTLLQAKLGLAQSGNLAVVEAQAGDDSYSSDYKLSLDTLIGTAADLSALGGFFGLTMQVLELKNQDVLGRSPRKATTDPVLADRMFYETGDVVNFKVKLDPVDVDFPVVGYNVDTVEIYRLTNDAVAGTTAELLTLKSAQDGQTTFDLPWTADEDGAINDDVFAFLNTKILPFPFFDRLEVDKVAPPPILVMDPPFIHLGDNPGTDPVGTTYTWTFDVPAYYPLATLEMTVAEIDLYPTHPSVSLNGFVLGITEGQVDPVYIETIDLTETHGSTCIFRIADGPFTFSADVSNILIEGGQNTITVTTYATPANHCTSGGGYPYDDIDIYDVVIMAK